MLKYIYEYYINNFEWFMRVEDVIYLKLDKLLEFLNSVNSLKDMYVGRFGFFEVNGVQFGEDLYIYERYCQGGMGLVLFRSVFVKFVFYFDNCFEDVVIE